MWRILNGLLLAIAMTATAMAADVVKPFKAETDLVRYAYYELLDAVLQRTTGKYGP